MRIRCAPVAGSRELCDVEELRLYGTGGRSSRSEPNRGHDDISARMAASAGHLCNAKLREVSELWIGWTHLHLPGLRGAAGTTKTPGGRREAWAQDSSVLQR